MLIILLPPIALVIAPVIAIYLVIQHYYRNTSR